MKLYYVHIPGLIYAANVYAYSEQEARKVALECLGVSHLPQDTVVWVFKVKDWHRL